MSARSDPPRPHTPPRRVATTDAPSSPLSSDTLLSKETHTTTPESAKRRNTPPRPVLAYARRVRAFASPLKNTKARRYLLTFRDSATANDWTKLMQQEYPDFVRVGGQQYCFKNDRVPERALDNPRFDHLKDRWNFRLVDDKENHATPLTERPKEKPSRPGKRASLMRMISSNSLGPIGESDRPPVQQSREASPTRLDDPFTGPATTPPVDLVELNRTLDRMQMMMNQTQLRIEVLTERQQTYADSMDRLQGALEANSTHIQALATEHQVGAITTKNLRSSIDTNTNHIRTILERQLHDAERMERVDSLMETCVERIGDVNETQKTSQTLAEEAAERIHSRVTTLLEFQESADRKLDNIATTMEYSKRLAKVPDPKPVKAKPEAISSSLQYIIEEQTKQIAELIASNINAMRHGQEQRSLHEQSRKQQEQLWTQRITLLQTQCQQQIADMRLEVTKVMDERMHEMEQSFTAGLELATRSINAVARKSAAKAQPPVVRCNHSVAPPPRKMNREMLGYWYKNE